MPLYNSFVATGGNIQGLYMPGDTALVFNAEKPLTGQLSVQLAIGQAQMAAQKSLRVDLIFSGDPGAFEFDVQDAGVDVQGAYQNVPALAAITNPAVVGPDGKFYISSQYVPFAGEFFALLCKTQTANNVTVTARVTLQ